MIWYRSGHRRTAPSWRVMLGCVLVLVLATAFGVHSSLAAGGQGQVPTTAVHGYTAGLPPRVAALYAHSGDILGPSAYRAWKPVKTPWTLCFNNSYLGNTWRAVTLATFNALAEKYKKLGLVSRYLSTNSNLNLPTQIQQMRNMIRVNHCSGIITIPTGTSGMDSIIQQAYQAGIPVVDDLGPTTTPYAENFDENFYFSGVKETQYLVNAIHGKGNLLDVIGIPGETIDVEYQSALKSVLSRYPGVHMAGQVVGKVTATIAQGAVLQFLSTHPQRIDAVFQEGGMGSGIIAAFQQEKRPLPALVFVGSGAMVSIFHDLLAKHQNPHFYALTDPPGFCMKKSFDTLIRLLEGQHPKNLTMFYPPPQITANNVNSWWNSKLTPTTTAWPEPPIDPFPDSVMNSYFTNGRAPVPYKG